MGTTVKDRAFGEMEYKHGWVKKQEVTLQGKIYNLTIRASAYTGEKICEEQRGGYRYFKDNVRKISDLCGEQIIGYVKAHMDDLAVNFPAIAEISANNLSEYVTPRTVLFGRDGSVVLLYDAKWDEENGLGVEVYPEVKVGQQDEFL